MFSSSRGFLYTAPPAEETRPSSDSESAAEAVDGTAIESADEPADADEAPALARSRSTTSEGLAADD